MYKGLQVSIVIPCLNEESGLAAMLPTVPPYVDEVIVVDNNSTDRTSDIATAMGARVIHEARQGYGRAHQAGFAAARGDIIAALDGDGSYPLEAIAPIIDHLLVENLDFVSGSRFPLANPLAMGRQRYLGNNLLTYAMRALFSAAIKDSMSGMWVFRRALLDRIHLSSPGIPFTLEIKLAVIQDPVLRFGEFPIQYEERIGASKLAPWRDGLRCLRQLLLKRLGRCP